MEDIHRPTLPVPAGHPSSHDRPQLLNDPGVAVPEFEPDDDTETAAEEIERVKAERDEYLDALRRLGAEFDNYRKRMIREQTAHLDRAAEEVIGRLLPVLDTVELAARHHPDTMGPVHRQLQETLAAEGLRRVDTRGVRFDPSEHEAAEHEAADAVVPLRREESRAQATVTEVLRPGYRFQGHLLRPALVRVRS